MGGAGAGPAIVARRPGPVQQGNPLAPVVLRVPAGELYPEPGQPQPTWAPGPPVRSLGPDWQRCGRRGRL